MTLYIKSCPRGDSRTDKLARALLSTLGDHEELDVVKEAAAGKLQPLTDDTLMFRESMIAAGNYTHPMFDYAKQFADADTIVIAAPYWDLSFPAALKLYVENIYIKGLVSYYEGDGRPHGMCKAEKLYYVTTSGGPYDPTYSYDYIATLVTTCFGIKETELIYVDMLDIDGVNPNDLIEAKIAELSNT